MNQDGRHMAITPHPDVKFRRLGDGMVLIHMGTNVIFEMNRSSARFWELLDEHRDVDRVRQRMAEEFDVAPSVLEQEVADLVDTLAAEGMVVWSD